MNGLPMAPQTVVGPAHDEDSPAKFHFRTASVYSGFYFFENPYARRSSTYREVFKTLPDPTNFTLNPATQLRGLVKEIRILSFGCQQALQKHVRVILYVHRLKAGQDDFLLRILLREDQIDVTNTVLNQELNGLPATPERCGVIPVEQPSLRNCFQVKPGLFMLSEHLHSPSFKLREHANYSVSALPDQCHTQSSHSTIRVCPAHGIPGLQVASAKFDPTVNGGVPTTCLTATGLSLQPPQGLCSKLAASQSLMFVLPPPAPEASSWTSPEKASDSMRPMCGLKVRNSSPVCVFQNLRV